MFAALCERRYKYKKNLANDVHCEPYFWQKYFFFPIFIRFLLSFSSFSFIICILNTLFEDFLPQKYKKWTKRQSSISSTFKQHGAINERYSGYTSG